MCTKLQLCVYAGFFKRLWRDDDKIWYSKQLLRFLWMAFNNNFEVLQHLKKFTGHEQSHSC